MQKEAARLSPEKAESTNRKAKQTIMKLVDAMLRNVCHKTACCEVFVGRDLWRT